MLDCTTSVSSEQYADFIYRHGYRDSEDVYAAVGTRCVDLLNSNFAIIYTPLRQAEPISFSKYPYASIPKLYGLLDSSALESSGVAPVLNQTNIKGDGSGVLIAFIDTGIEYTNPLFCNTDGSSRILGIWDQTIERENQVVPTLPRYGTYYPKSQLDLALASDNPLEIVPSTDTNGHGTFLAGVAAGNTIKEPTTFSGAAPNASLIIVKLKPAKQYLRDFYLIDTDNEVYQENDIMLALQFVQDQARYFRMPLVICLALGTSQGSHDGNSALGIQLQYQQGLYGLTTVVAAGNETGYQHHYFGTTTPTQDFDEIELLVGKNEFGFCLELWVREPELYAVGFTSPSGQTIERIPMIIGNETRIPFRLDNSVLTVNYQTTETGTGSQLIFLRFQTPAPGIWRIRVYPLADISGEYHAWLPMNGFISKETVFLRPNIDTILTDPANTPLPLTIGNYNHIGNNINIHSSRGYTRIGTIKPDLAAPGVNIQGPTLQSSTGILRFTQKTGTSVSAAITAGAIAGLFTWAIVEKNDPTLTSTSVRAMLIRGAKRNPNFTYPNKEWGYGTLNLFDAINLSFES